MNLKRQAVAALLAGLIAAGCFVHLAAHPELTTGYDFSAYYCGFRAFKFAADPYNAAALGVCQHELGHNFEFGPAQMWYGPWVFVLLAPVLALPYHSAGAVWFMLNLVFLLAAGALAWRAAGQRRLAAAAFLAAALFYPNIEALAWNQLGPLITAGIAAFLFFERRERDALAGICLLPTSLKPHLFFLLFPAFLWWSLRQRRMVPLLAFGGSLALLSAAAELLSPGVISAWTAVLHAPPLVQKTPTLAGIVRGWIYAQSGQAPFWPAWVFPTAALTALLIWLAARRPKFRWLDVYLPLASASLLFAPYAFVHDFTLLLIGQVVLAARALQPEVSPEIRRQVLGMCVLLQLVALILGAAVFTSTPAYFWYPAACALIWARSRVLLPPTPRAPADRSALTHAPARAG